MGHELAMDNVLTKCHKSWSDQDFTWSVTVALTFGVILVIDIGLLLGNVPTKFHKPQLILLTSNSIRGHWMTFGNAPPKFHKPRIIPSQLVGWITIFRNCDLSQVSFSRHDYSPYELWRRHMLTVIKQLSCHQCN
jgi:hypothetical protein